MARREGKPNDKSKNFFRKNEVYAHLGVECLHTGKLNSCLADEVVTAFHNNIAREIYYAPKYAPLKMIAPVEDSLM